jgi:hypothetical protein
VQATAAAGAATATAAALPRCSLLLMFSPVSLLLSYCNVYIVVVIVVIVVIVVVGVVYHITTDLLTLSHSK